MIRMTFIAALAAATAGPVACQERGAAPPPAAGAFRVIFPELAAHGTAIVLQTPSGATVLVDTGKKEGGYDAGRDTLAPFLRSMKVEEIRAILLSHPHHDHFEGASHLLKNFRVKTLVDAGVEGPGVDEKYFKLRTAAKEQGVEVRVVHAGDKLSWDDSLEVTVLAPPKEGVPSAEKDALNNNSIVLRVRHGQNVFLLPGDIEGEGSDALLKACPAETLKATVLAAPHHGFSDHKRFAEATKPRIVVVSCLNEYTDKKVRSPGLLATEVFGAVGAKVYVTAWHGTVEVVSDGKTVSVKTQRAK